MTNDSAYWETCPFRVLARSHYLPDGQCRCSEEHVGSGRGRGGAQLPPPFKYERPDLEPYSPGAIAWSRRNGYASPDAFFMEDQARDWLAEAAEVGHLCPSWGMIGSTEPIDLLMERVSSLLALTDDEEALRQCLSEAVADVARLEYAERGGVTRLPAGIGPWAPGPTWRAVQKMLAGIERHRAEEETRAKKEGRRAKVQATLTAKHEAMKTREELLLRIKELEAEVRRLQGGSVNATRESQGQPLRR